MQVDGARRPAPARQAWVGVVLPLVERALVAVRVDPAAVASPDPAAVDPAAVAAASAADPAVDPAVPAVDLVVPVAGVDPASGVDVRTSAALGADVATSKSSSRPS